MKRRWPILLLCAALPTAAACAYLQRTEVLNTTDLLERSGFRELPANTPERQQDLATLQPHTLHAVYRDGAKYWVYPDPTGCHCLYVGRQDNLDYYRELELEEDVAQQNWPAVLDSPDEERRFGAWGPWW